MTFDEWFQSKQGEPYDSMYVFARDAWTAATAAEREACARIADDAAENDCDLSAYADAVAYGLAKAIALSIRERIP